jgi:hypothetical protein
MLTVKCRIQLVVIFARDLEGIVSSLRRNLLRKTALPQTCFGEMPPDLAGCLYPGALD